MFLNDLSTDEKTAFLGLTKKMIAADNILTSEELEMLRDVTAEMELDSEIEIAEVSVEKLCAEVSASRSQAFMLLELSSFAQVDNEYAAAERDLLRTIAGHWKIDPITTNRIEAWGLRRIQLSREAAEIVREVASPLGRT